MVNPERPNPDSMTDMPASIREAASLHGFVAIFACVVCIMIFPTALFALTATYAFGIWLTIAITCILIRSGILRAIRLSFWAAVVLDIAGVLMVPYVVGSELFAHGKLSIDVLFAFFFVVLISLPALVSLLHLKRREAWDWILARRARE